MNPDELEWTTKDGRKIKVSKMTNSHLCNALVFMRRRKQAAALWCKVLEDEMCARAESDLMDEVFEQQL